MMELLIVVSNLALVIVTLGADNTIVKLVTIFTGGNLKKGLTYRPRHFTGRVHAVHDIGKHERV